MAILRLSSLSSFSQHLCQSCGLVVCWWGQYMRLKDCWFNSQSFHFQSSVSCSSLPNCQPITPETLYSMAGKVNVGMLSSHWLKCYTGSEPKNGSYHTVWHSALPYSCPAVLFRMFLMFYVLSSTMQTWPFSDILLLIMGEVNFR